MRIPDYTIPATFIRLDDHTTEADSFFNVRDSAIMRNNHNVSVAQRIRREVAHVVFNQLNGDVAFTYYCRNRPGQGSPFPIVWLGQVLISQWTAELELVFEASKGALDGASTSPETPTLYAKLYRDPGMPNVNNLESVNVTALVGSPAKYTLTLPVPQQSSVNSPWRGYEFFWLAIYADTPVDTTVLKVSAAPVLNSGANWVEIATGAPYTDQLIYVNSDASVAPRQITQTDSIAGGRRHWVDQDWSRSLVVTTDTMRIRNLIGVTIHSLSIYELAVTDLSQRDAPG